MSKCVWTNASGDFSAANPNNWEGGRVPKTLEDWPTNNAPDPYGYFASNGFANFTKDGWPAPIPVTERLPEVNEDVLGFCRVCGIWEPTYQARCDALPDSTDPEISGWVGDAECRFTHWLPLPPKPE